MTKIARQRTNIHASPWWFQERGFRKLIMGSGEMHAFPSTYHTDGASVPLISRKSYPSSSWKSVKTRAMVSPGSARMVHVQSALFSYSEGKWGLEIVLLVPRKVPPQAPSAGRDRSKRKPFSRWSHTHRYLQSVTLGLWQIFPNPKLRLNLTKGFFGLNSILWKGFRKSNGNITLLNELPSQERAEVWLF